MKKLLLLVALMTFASDAGTPSVASAAGTSWRIRIDNESNPLATKYWGSDDDVEVWACTSIALVPCTLVKVIEGPTGIRNSFDIVVPESVFSFGLLGAVVVGATGGDLFVIDQLRLYDTDGVERRKWGTDSMHGYCVSTQESDVDDPACRNAGGPICGWSFAKVSGLVTGYECN